MAKKKRKKAGRKGAGKARKKVVKRAGRKKTAAKKKARKPRVRRSAKDIPGQKVLGPEAEEALEAEEKGGVECLGQRFENDNERRAHFMARLKEGLEELHEKLAVPFAGVDEAVRVMRFVEKWPMGEPQRLRKMAERTRRDRSDKSLLQRWKDQVGFPHGEIEDIFRLSDPPYYTACPNPFLAEFVEHYGKPFDPNEFYSRKPFAVDVSEGKTDPLYKAHSYHTKVPHLAIVPSILHYTEPGDIVLDGFAGTGMTGVAAQFCGRAPRAYRDKLEAEWEEQGLGKPKWGTRRVVLNDLAPSATFIAANYNTPFNVKEFAREGQRILNEVEDELGWMYETLHKDGKTKGRIDYTVWSEVLTCPQCSNEIVFLDEALDNLTGKVRGAFPCPHCGVETNKRTLERTYSSGFDKAVGATTRTLKRRPVRIVYRVSDQKHSKQPDDGDLSLLSKIESMGLPINVPTSELPYMHMTHERARMDAAGITHTHHFFLHRPLHAMAALWKLALVAKDVRMRNMLLFFVEQAMWTASVQNRFRPTGYSQVNQYMTGIYYVPSQTAECSPWYILGGKLKRLRKAFAGRSTGKGTSITQTANAATMPMSDNSVDYVFTDPPFGENLYYADLNYLVESWHRLFTNASGEAIIDRARRKGLHDYQRLMQSCFAEYCRVLKPGRWMTVVFHNSKNAVWNAIQEAMLAAGFVVADVRTLDKKQGSYRQVTSTAVKQDLVISAYKPNGGLEERFKLEAGTEDGVWDFVRSHLRQLPVFVEKDDRAEVIVERQNFLLYDRMVAFHVQRGVTVPLSAAEFYGGLSQRFIEREGMYFLPEQAAEYDQKRMGVQGVGQMVLFVTDEESAIRWLRQRLRQKPQTFQELHPQFTKPGWDKFEKPIELSDVLAQNFLCYDGEGEIPVQIVESLELDPDDPDARREARNRWYVPDASKATDLERLRERALLKEFQEYRESTQRKLKTFRLEAVRAGFKKAWQDYDYKAIIEVAKKVPDAVLQEDPKLLMFYDNAVTRTGED